MKRVTKLFEAQKRSLGIVWTGGDAGELRARSATALPGAARPGAMNSWWIVEVTLLTLQGRIPER
jgi:hypothetical protein